MTGPALSLILVAAVLHAVWNIAAKRVQGNGYVFVWQGVRRGDRAGGIALIATS